MMLFRVFFDPGRFLFLPDVQKSRSQQSLFCKIFIFRQFLETRKPCNGYSRTKSRIWTPIS